MGLGNVVTLAGALAIVQVAGGGLALGDERPRTSSAVSARAQGGGGLEPVQGAPPAIEPSLEVKTVRATLAPGVPRASVATPSFRAVSAAQGQVTLEIDGACEVVRRGSELGGDVVKAVEAGRIVLDRPARPGQAGGAALVIMTFDAAGAPKTRVFYTGDPDALPAGVKHP